MNPLHQTDLILRQIMRESPSRKLRANLYLAIRRLILEGELRPGSLLPPSRQLADQIGCSRSTLVRVYEQLREGGYLQTVCGSGTRVSDALPESAADGPGAARRPGSNLVLSARGREIAGNATSSRIQGGAFVPGVPDVGLFPFEIWRRLLSKNIRFEQRHLARYSHGGYGPLKVALSEHLKASRMMSCSPQQILILNGSHQAIDLCARMLCDAGDRVWMEDPGYWGARNVLRANGLELVPVPVDHEGIVPSRGRAADPRLIFVSPSSQYPTGALMSLRRRLQLLEFAETQDAWVIEDDYDNEIRYHPHSIGALFGQSRDQRVLYLGTFSKVMFPGLRLAYLVVPEDLVDAFSTGNAELYREGRLIEQAALAEFIDAGHLGSHLKRVRGIYQERRGQLRVAIESRLGEHVRSTGGLAGLHMTYVFDRPIDDLALAQEALADGIVFRPLSMYYGDRARTLSGMVLGFAAVSPEDIDAAASRLCALAERRLRDDRPAPRSPRA